MKRTNLKLFVLGLLLPLTFAACGAKDYKTASIDLMKKVNASELGEIGRIPSGNARASIAYFTVELLKSSMKNEGNLMISPASVYFALGMTLNGAEGETKAEMIKMLNGERIDPEILNMANLDWKNLLSEVGDKTTLEISNALWFDKNFIPDQPFLQRNADYYSAEARKVDFKDTEAKDIINSWVKETTHGTIEEIVDELDENKVMFLINTVYFKSDWQVPFEKNNTMNRAFNAPSGSVDVPFLHRTGNIVTFSYNDGIWVALPYDDGQLSYFAMMPDDGVTPRDWIEKQESNELVSHIASNILKTESELIDLAMPKFEVKYEDSLKDDLESLGMKLAFDPDLADFSAMNAAHEKNLFINDVKHKTYIKVDEKGTEASAATSVEVETTSLPMPNKEVTFDRPFVYGIIDMKTGLPIFLGIMENPDAK
ncbi:MAG: serpin family protein [Clostridiaceae bacterium]